jgi:UDP-2-acetamido-3-amino-2,3-dideoxy-glucuronate N-acetyltransferase
MESYVRIAADVVLGIDVKIFAFVNLYGCQIGDRTKVGTFVEIQKNAFIGRDCKISSHTFICEGVVIGNGVFVGHNVTFINDLYPRAINADNSMQTEADWTVVPTYIEDGASIGSSVTILCGATIGKGSIVGAGSVVTKSIPAGEIWAGNPARYIRKVATHASSVFGSESAAPAVEGGDLIALAGNY